MDIKRIEQPATGHTAYVNTAPFVNQVHQEKWSLDAHMGYARKHIPAFHKPPMGDEID